MPRRKLPSPEEYGKRLAEAKRRAEKQTHERARRSEDSFNRVLKQLAEQKQALAAVGAELEALPRDVLTPGDFIKALEDLTGRITAIQAAIENINLDVPAPTVPESLEKALNDLVQMAKQPVQLPVPPKPTVDPQVPLDPPETIFAGPVTLKVTGRDVNGDIEDVRVEPTRH